MRAVLHARGGAGIPVVYVPGIDGTGEMLLGLEERLAGEFEVMRLRYEAGGEDSYEHLAATVRGVMADLGVARGLLLAESFGGAVALMVALQEPGRVAGLALVNTFARYPHRLRLGIGCSILPLVPRSLYGLARRIGGPATMFAGRGGAAEKQRFFERDAGVCAYDDLFLARLRMIRGLDLRPRLGEIRCPVRLFAGTRDVVLSSLAQARELERALPAAQLRIIAGGGHLILPLQDLPWPEWLLELAEASKIRGSPP
jgi:pimeloyl-ACP methyl ester carboxylesterase